MAALQKLRNQAGLLVAIVIFVALAAFILGDFFQSGSSMLQGHQLEIANIEGESVKYPEFQARFDELANIYKSNNNLNSLDDEAYQQLLNQTWDALVREKLMGTVYENIGIEVTPNEMFEMVQGANIHPIVRQLFADPNTGQVDKGAVIQFLKYINENPTAPQKEFWMYVEKQILTEKKSTKYTDLVGKALYVNTLQAKKSLVENNKTVDLKFIRKNLDAISDSTIKVSDSEIKAYYEAHKENFKQDARRNLSFVVFEVLPSAQDDADAQKSVADLKSDFISATDNAQFVNMNSDERFEDIYVKPEVQYAPVAEWLQMAQVNEVYGPYKEGNVYKMVKLNAVKQLPDSVKASHILLRVQSQNEYAAATKKIDSLKSVIEGGAKFEDVARQFSQDGSAPNGGDLGWFGRGQMVRPFETAAFNAEKGDLVVAETQFGIHLIKVMEQSKKSQHVQLATIEREVTASSQTSQQIYSEASRFAAEAQDLEGFNRIVAEKQMNKRPVAIGENDRSIAGLGASRPMIRAAFIDSEVGDLVHGADNSAVYEIENKFVVAAIEKESEKGYQTVAEARTAIEMTLRANKKREQLLADFAKAQGSSIEEIGGKLNLQVEQAAGLQLNYGSVNAIGYEPAITGAASVLEANRPSKPFAGRNGVYVIQLTNIADLGNTNVAAEKANQFRSSSYRASFQAYNTIKNNSEVEDKRVKFY